MKRMADGFPAFSIGLGKAQADLDRLGREIAQEVRSGLRRIGRTAARRAKTLTPRSELGGPHLADGWRLIEEAPGVFVVENQDPRGSEPLPLEDGRETSLLEILEYGSRPHEIVPKRPGGLLRFVLGGEVVYTRHVDHPGTRPYAMIGIASTEAAVEVKVLADALRALIRSSYL